MVWAAISEGVSAGRVLGDGEHEAGSRDGGQEAAAWIQEVHVESQAKTLARGTGRRGQVWEALHESTRQDWVAKGQSIALLWPEWPITVSTGRNYEQRHRVGNSQEKMFFRLQRTNFVFNPSLIRNLQY